MFQSMGLQRVGQDLATEQHKRGDRGREEHTVLVKTKQLVRGKFYNQLSHSKPLLFSVNNLAFEHYC